MAASNKSLLSTPSNSSEAAEPWTGNLTEATAMRSPTDLSDTGRPCSAELPTNYSNAPSQPSDGGSIYLSDNGVSQHTLNSPVREKQALEKKEAKTAKAQATDLKITIRARIAKVFLRSVDFICSLIVLAMQATTFSIFNATRTLPPRNGLPPWAYNTKTGPQIALLVIAAVSVSISVIIFLAYCGGCHNQAEKVSLPHRVFSVALFVFSIIMWAIGAGILSQSKAQGNGQDIWNWSCNDNKRRELFQEDIAYALICKIQDWSFLCCIIQVIVGSLTIIIYGIVFYSQHRLMKSMALRDRARSELYLAQLQAQSNTPDFRPPLPANEGGKSPPGHLHIDPCSAVENSDQPDAQHMRRFAQQMVQQTSFDTPALLPRIPPFHAHLETQQEHVPAALNEQRYEAVPLPGTYLSNPAAPLL